MKYLEAFAALRGATRIALFVGALLLSALPVPSSAAPVSTPLGDGGVPIYVVGLRQIGLPGKDYGPLMSDALQGIVGSKFSCTTTTSPSDLAALLGWAKDQQLLGTPEDEQIKLENIGKSLGNMGVLIFGSFGKAGNNYFVNIKAVDPKTAKTIDNQMVTAPGDDDSILLDLINKAVSQMDVKACQSKWTGTITVTDKWDYFLQGPGYIPLMAIPVRNPKSVGVTYTERTDVMGATLPPYVGRGSSGNKSDATLTHTTKESGFIYNLGTLDVDCSGSWGKQMRGEYEWRPWIGESDTTWKVDARDTAQGTVTVEVDRNGHYKITWTAPQMKEKRVQRTFGKSHPSPCEAAQNFESPTIEPEFTTSPHEITIEGDVDPTKPNELSGESTVKTPEWVDPTGAKNTSSTTKSWRLTASSTQ